MLENVVAQNHQDRLAIAKILCQADGVGQAPGLFLDFVGNFQAEFVARPQKVHKLAGVLGAGGD